MDWEANLAAIIRCTDASLEQQFRQFEDVTAEFAADEPPAQQRHEDPSDNVATAYLRETMASDYRHRQQEQRRQTPSYTRVSGAFPRGPAAAAQASTTSFSEHFHRQQERKRGAAATAGRARDNQRAHGRGHEYGPAEEDAQVQDHEVDESRYAPTRQAGSGGVYHQQMYSSPTYDIAQMMEQVRLSLKLEVDARAAIAERQLSALLQLCKATSEELDRLRVEVCANDRQLHTLDQVQSKIRQELTTQKDIGFHLQSMCGKDESWRMQTENQLLELRQMVAALREQGNSTQAVAQEKLSRSELLVQFNAAMEPIKAQLQANLQHQAQQIAEITRTTSSSSLLLDGLTQKVNRGVTDEINELRSDLNALKHHVAKLDIFQDGGRGDSRTPSVLKEETEAKAKEEQLQQEKRLADVREGILKEVTLIVKDYVDAQTIPIRKVVDDSVSKFIRKQEMENLRGVLEEGCRNRCTATTLQADGQLKAAQEQLRSENNVAMRELSDKTEKSVQQVMTTMTTAMEKQASSWQSKQLDLVKLLEAEQKERKQALDDLHEALRKSRHQLEDQIHTLTQENRAKLSQHDSDLEKRLNTVEKQVEKAVADLHKENQEAVATLKTSFNAQGGSRDAEWEQKLKRLEDTISGTNLTVAALSKSLASTPAATTTTATPSNDSSSKEVSLALEKQTSVYVSTMENLLQKMQLQLQLQAQSQAQLAMAPSPYHGFWPPSPYAASHAPPPPTLQLPPAMSRGPAEHHPSTPVGAVHAKSAPVPAPSVSNPGNPVIVETQLDKSANLVKEAAGGDKSDDRVRSATPVKQLEHSLTTSPPPNEAASVPSPPPEVLELMSKPQSTSDQREPQIADKQSDANNREHTLATTAKGAMAEAELAKARVENRRKQEQEAKQQQQRQPPAQVTLANAQVSTRVEAPALKSTDPVEGGSRRSSVPVVLTGPPPPMTRSASSSALPVKDTVARTNPPAVQNKPPTPVSVPSTPTTSASVIRAAPPPPTSVPPQPLAKPDGVPVVSPTPAGSSEAKPPLAGPSASVTRAPQIDPKREVDSRPPPTQPAPIDHKPALSIPATLATPQQDVQIPTLPAPSSQPASSATKDECPAPLSPLAKIFARPATEETPRPETQPSSKTLSTPIPEKAEEIQQTQLPSASTQATTPVSSSLSGVRVESPPVSHVLCSLCRLPVRSDQKTEHEKSLCPKRLVECVSCKQQMQWVSLEMHELECNRSQASKSEVLGTEANPSETKSPPEGDNAAGLEGSVKKCRHCSADVPSLDLLEHEINCDKVLKQCPHCLRRQKMSELQEHIENCDCRLVSCPNDCGGKFLQRGIPNHLATRCPKKPVTNAAPAVAAAPRPSYPEPNKPAPAPQAAQPPSAAAPAGKVECKFCDDEIEASRIDDHEQNCDWKPKRCQHCNMVVISRDLQRHETSCKTNLKSCPHCNENMPQSALTTHAGRCSKRPIKCIRCCQLFPADAIVAHSTNCKFVPGATPPSGSPSSQLQSQASQPATARVPIKIPPPPPFPPPPTATTPVPASQQLNTRRATADPRVGANRSNDSANVAEETTSDRLARRNLALSQLTNPGAPATGGSTLLQDRNTGARSSAPSLYPTTPNSLQTRLSMRHDVYEDAEDEEDDDGEYDDEDEDDQLTLAQVVKEWSVENVCLWLHEDVGVPDVVLRFQQKQCNGEMLLELTESDLINDFGVRDRVQRERILNAIEAINTSTAFSDDDDEEDDDDDEEEEEEDANEDDEDELEESEEARPHMRHSIGGATYGHPRDILRRKSQPSPQRILNSSLPSSNDMLRRISNALENPKR